MARPKSLQPSDLELEVLRILWQRGPSTSRQVFEALAGDRTVASVHLLLRSMSDKQYVKEVRRKKSEGGHLYTAAISREQTGGRMLSNIFRKIFGQDVAPALQRLLTADDLTDQELKDIHELIQKKRKGQK